MPDWFYRTVSQPILFRLPARTARDLALGFLGGLARLPFGPVLIDFLGHMRADPRLRRSFLDIEFPSAVGLGPGLDARAWALPALARFGFGFLEVGPVTLTGGAAGFPVERDDAQQALLLTDPPAALGLTEAVPRLAEATRLGLPLMVRLGCAAGADAEGAADECRQLVRALAGHAHLFTLATLGPAVASGWPAERWAVHVQAVAAEAKATGRPLLLGVAADLDPDAAEPFLGAAIAAGVAGFHVDGSVAAKPAGRWLGLPARAPARHLVQRLRQRWGGAVLIVAAGGVHEPADALALHAAGADLVQADSGLVFTGPGLPKRINDAFLFEAVRAAPPPGPPPRAPEMTWFWTTCMGAAMLVGALLALAFAAGPVVLPYDEAFVGMSREQLAAVNPRLLHFMAHDRVSLAGTMIAIGMMYVGLSVFGIRAGLHWARQAVYFSAFTGFASFFLFLGYGYLDAFHAFVTAALLQLLLLGVHCRLGTWTPDARPDVVGDWAWRLGLWGQLLLIVHGCGLLAAGGAISTMGVTRVFVPEDLEFMQTTAEALRAANPRLVPLVAHDRATFGGMLLASGWVFLLPALWGNRGGAAWLWWTMLTAGLCAYLPALGVHFAVGYSSPTHLLPAFTGLILFLLGLGLSYPFLCRSG